MVSIAAKIALTAAGLLTVPMALIEGCATTIHAAPAAPRTPSPERELGDLLDSLRGTWVPPDYQTLLDARGIDLDCLTAGLRDFLGAPDPLRLEPALQLVFDLNLAGCHPEVARLALDGPPASRALALRVAERLSPWSPSQLESFLDDDVPAVRAAALQLWTARDDRPTGAFLGAVFGNLCSADAGVRAAAFAALPSELGDEHRAVLAQWLETGDGLQAVQALRALGARGLAAAEERAVYRRLGDHDPCVQDAALGALAASRRPLADPGEVLDLAVRSNDPAIQAHALRVLEDTASCSAAEVDTVANQLHPAARYFAARCLLRSHQRAGAELLVEVVTADDSELGGLGDLPPAAVRSAAARALAQLSGRSCHSGVEDWNTWLASGEPFQSWRLPAAPAFAGPADRAE